uniref:hypothetical protein n=1 Tax=uncultured Allobacillus sp. TaxID=1638025 RepID=UPI0025927D28|nr:hypothetical protein [uncultured Allobacillus sp.]
MAYLTYEEYKDLALLELDQTEFERLLPEASKAIDSITHYFYRQNDLESDVNFRRVQFKNAVVCQIEYFHDMGATSTHELNSPLTVNMGRTQVMTGVENQKKRNSLIAPDVYMYLSHTGLLYSGVSTI